jgi:hypothetical protein
MSGVPSAKNLLFLKKKKQKDFYSFALRAVVSSGSKVGKVFWFFFSKKNMLPSLAPFPAAS